MLFILGLLMVIGGIFLGAISKHSLTESLWVVIAIMGVGMMIYSLGKFIWVTLP